MICAIFYCIFFIRTPETKKKLKKDKREGVKLFSSPFLFFLSRRHRVVEKIATAKLSFTIPPLDADKIGAVLRQFLPKECWAGFYMEMVHSLSRLVNIKSS